MKTLSMKLVTPYLRKIGVVILLCGFLSLFNANQNYSPDLDIEKVNSSETPVSYFITPRASIIHGPIFIDGDDGANNWDTFPNKTGSGTYVDPYLIEHLEIDAGGIGSGIFIQDSDVYVEILNCTMTNAGNVDGDAGIHLSNCSNIKLFNCTSEYNGYYGFYIENGSFNNTILDNDASYNDYIGVGLFFSSNTTLSGNIANNNSIDGIYLFSSSNNTLSGNIANGNSNDGISLYHFVADFICYFRRVVKLISSATFK